MAKLAAVLLAGTLLAGCTATVGGVPRSGQLSSSTDSDFGPLPQASATPTGQNGPNVPSPAEVAAASAIPEPSSAAFVPGGVLSPLEGTYVPGGDSVPLTVAEARSGSIGGDIIPAALPDGTMMPVLPAGSIAVPGSPGFAVNGNQIAALTTPDFPPAPSASAQPVLPQNPAAIETAAAAGEVSTPGPEATTLPAAPAQTAETQAAPTGKTSRPARKSLLEGLFGSRAQPVESVQLASASAGQTAAGRPVQELTNVSPSAASLTSLPGVDTKNLFGIERGTADNELYDDHPEEPVQLASATAAGLARLAPNGILKQRDNVEVNCFKPELVRVLKSIERHYGKKLVVTSGFRSPKNNRRAGGSSRSMHMYCAAADIQVPGVGKWQLAKFLRSMPGRGGVGTYCHTDSVHIDIGSKRDWNWRCRRR